MRMEVATLTEVQRWIYEARCSVAVIITSVGDLEGSICVFLAYFADTARIIMPTRAEVALLFRSCWCAWKCVRGPISLPRRHSLKE